MSELAGISTAPLSLKPGMSQVINAGETLRISDVNGDEIAVEAREDPKVLDFLRAFDTWRSAKNVGVAGHVLDSLVLDVESAFRRLPTHVTRELPSTASRGVVLPTSR